MKKQGKNLPPPWMLGAKDIRGVPMIVVHMQNGELEGLDNLQGGPSVDSSTGIREYSQLADIIEIPEIKDLFHAVSSQLQEHGEVSPDINKAYKIAKRHSLPYRETEEEEHNPLDALEKKTGRGGDTKFALIPVNLAELLIEIRHLPSVNPNTGLLEFGFFGSIGKFFKKVFPEALRVVGTVGGAILGGPVGAGVGNAAARAVTGSSIKNSVIGGLKTGALTYGAQAIGQAMGLGASTPYSAGFFGGAPNMLARGLGGLGMGAAGSMATPGAGAVAAGASAAPGVAAASGGMGGLLLPAAAMLGMSYMGSKKHYQLEKEAMERREARDAKERQEQGWSTNWTPIASKRREVNPEFYNTSEEDIKHGRVGDYAFRDAQGYAKGGLVQSYSKGTLVRGKGKGQDDKIKTSVPDGAYIIDASSTSMLGDGSSTAGSEVLSKFENHIRNKFPKKLISTVNKEVSKRSQQVPVWLSDSEYKIDPVTVTLLGNGSNKEGADILRDMVNKLRKHKASRGHKLPPKAKHPLEYIGGRI